MKHLILFSIISYLSILGGCSTEDPEPILVLSNVQINTISVSHFPSTENGSDWDVWTSHPDIYVAISDNSGRIYSTEYYDKSRNTNTYNFEEGLPLYLEDINEEYLISLYDYDSTSEDEWMGGFNLTFAPHEGQSTIVLSSEENEITLTLDVEWNYKEVW